MQLPQLIKNDRNKGPIGVAAIAVSQLAYLAANHFHFYQPMVLPLFSPDLAIPLIPETIWIYQTVFMMVIVAYLTNEGRTIAMKFIYTGLLMTALSVAVFVAFPITYPRNLYPLPLGLDQITSFLFSSVRGIDTPANCLPSLHVSACCLVTLVYGSKSLMKTALFAFWSFLIILSTLTTKQHYFVDTVTGAALAFTVYRYFFNRLILTEKDQLAQVKVDLKNAA